MIGDHWQWVGIGIAILVLLPFAIAILSIKSSPPPFLPVGISTLALVAAVVSATFSGLNYYKPAPPGADPELARRGTMIAELIRDYQLTNTAKLQRYPTEQEWHELGQAYINDRLSKSGERWRYDAKKRTYIDP